ncbi:MAG: PCRF domain-containing protein, partial [Anaerolineae bacterium]|nr:PCRF domain-containing protein [Anaerolineae bacterium]
MDNLISLLTRMKDEIDGLMARLDIPGKAQRIADIEKLASATDFWNDQETAQNAMQEMSRLKAEVSRWQGVANRINDALELAELGDESLFDELTTETETLTQGVERLSFQAMLSGRYDSENAILAIHAGAG